MNSRSSAAPVHDAPSGLICVIRNLIHRLAIFTSVCRAVRLFQPWSLVSPILMRKEIIGADLERVRNLRIKFPLASDMTNTNQVQPQSLTKFPKFI